MKKIVLLSLLLLGGLFYFLWPVFGSKKNPPSLETLLTYSSEGKEKEILSFVKEKEELFLLRGAWKMMEQDFSSARTYLTRAEKNLLSSDLKVQASLLLALNSYFTHEDDAFFTHLQTAEKKDLLRTDDTLLPALAAFLKNDNERAKQLFLHASEKKEDLFSLVSKKLLTPLWQDSHLALLFLEEGEDREAKELLEKRIDPLHLEKSEDAKLASFVLGLTHQSIASRLSEKDQDIAQKMSLYFLEQAGSLNSFTHERALGTSLLVENMKKIPDSRSLIVFLPYLERWHEEKALESFACLLIEREENMEELLAKVQKGPFSFLLTKKIREKLVSSLKNQSIDTDFLLTLFGKEALREMQGDIEACILQSLSDFRNTEELLDLWNRLAVERKFLTTTLIEQGELLWKQGSKEKSCNHLFALLLRYSNRSEKEEIVKELSRFFTSLFKEAESSYTVKRLLLIKEAITELAIPCTVSLKEEMIANTVEDSKYLFEARNFVSSQLAAKLAYSCDSNDERALYLIGLSSFHMGEYKEALWALKKLSNPDEEAKRALYFCQVEIEGKAIVQVNREFSEEN